MTTSPAPRRLPPVLSSLVKAIAVHNAKCGGWPWLLLGAVVGLCLLLYRIPSRERTRSLRFQLEVSQKRCPNSSLFLDHRPLALKSTEYAAITGPVAAFWSPRGHGPSSLDRYTKPFPLLSVLQCVPSVLCSFFSLFPPSFGWWGFFVYLFFVFFYDSSSSTRFLFLSTPVPSVCSVHPWRSPRPFRGPARSNLFYNYTKILYLPFSFSFFNKYTGFFQRLPDV